ncbi:MAG: aminopeptidase N [Gammaproteobacteria bacterium]|nr:aminopeptidase N [Gammaproteobacteria bacterium]
MVDIKNTDAAPRTIFLKDYQPPVYLIDHVKLHFDLHETQTVVTSTLRVSLNEEYKQADKSLVLDGQNLELLSIKIDAKSLTDKDYVCDDEALTIATLPEKCEIEIQTRINPEGNKALEGLYLSSGMFCTQCEAQGFRRITYFPDRPDVMSTYEVTMIGDKEKYPILLSNGNLIEKREESNGKHWAKWQDPSLKPSYLFALVAGDLFCKEDTYTTMSGREIALQVFVEHENSHKCDHALMSLKQAMKWDEDTYGREYDLDIYMIVAVNDFNMGAMENKGLNVFNASCVLASPDTATDGDYYNIQSIIAHEYFHNWSGNRVTCRDWFQLSLKEGFTVFRDQEFSADLNSRAVKRIDDVNVLRTHQFAQDAGPMAHPIRPDHYIEISNFYTVTVYNKGAEVVRMIRNLVGNEGFRKGTDLYFERHDGQAVTTEDFVASMEDANDIDLSLFKNWYSQAGTPVLDVKTTFNEKDKTFKLEIKQFCPDTVGQKNKQPFHIPLKVGLLDKDGSDVVLQLEGDSSTTASTLKTLEIKNQVEIFTFLNVNNKPLLSLNRGFTSPVKIQLQQSVDDLAFLFAHDSDEFNRWEAGQTLAMNTLLGLVNNIQNNQTLALNTGIINAFRNTLTNSDLDKALIAQALTLPSESYLADQCNVVDVDAIHQARTFMRNELAKALKDDFKNIYQSGKSEAIYLFDADEMARRNLNHVCLSYLMCLQEDETIDACMTQIDNANNMTDVLSALSILSHYDNALRQQALDSFYDKWKNDAQVVEKWFSIQASADLPDILGRVKVLMQHEAFTVTNPNKVRSLIGRFCTGNIVHFHAADGSGYKFLADQVLALDNMNPQIAARLVQSMSRWRRYDHKRQELMKKQLERILDKKDLSKDVYEITSRSLNG